MDQLPVEISQRIRHEARVAGLNEHAPSIEMVERRRLQLWSMTIVIMIGIGLASLAVSGATGQTSWITGDPWILAGGVSVLAVASSPNQIAARLEYHQTWEPAQKPDPRTHLYRLGPRTTWVYGN